MKHYFDYASTSKVDEDVLNSYIKYSGNYYNPSALYTDSNSIKKDIDNVRKIFISYLKL